MLDQLFELSRKAVESSLEMQQAMFKHWTQDILSTAPAQGISADWGGSMRKRWVELIMEALHKHREALDTTYRSLIQTMEQAFRVSEARSSEDFVRAVEDVRRRSFDIIKGQAEAQIREFQSWAEKSFDMATKAEA